MNKFQRDCIDACTTFLQGKGYDVDRFQEVAGKNERFMTTRFAVGNFSYQIFVYDDEAGLMIDDEWFPCEKADFETDGDLIRAFVELLEKKMKK